MGALLGVTGPRLWRSLRALVDQAHAQVEMNAVTAVGVDEKYVGRLGTITVVHERRARARYCMSAAAARRSTRVSSPVPLSAHGGDPQRIDTCTLDMSRAFIAGMATHLPNVRPVTGMSRLHPEPRDLLKALQLSAPTEKACRVAAFLPY